MRPVVPRQIRILNVPLGAQRESSAGDYVTGDSTVTVRIEGDTSNVFSVTQVETFDVEADPDTRPPQLVLVPALQVIGPGPIEVFEGEAILASIEFSCPPDPPQGVFTAT